MLNYLNFFFALIVSILIGCKSNPQEESEAVSLGAILSLSGPAGEQGQNIRKGIELFVDEHNAQHNRKIKFFLEDDATQPAKAIASFQKLITVNRVIGVVGGTWDYLGEAIFPLATKQKVFTVSATSPEEILSKEAFDSNFVKTTSPALKKEKQAIKELLLFKKPHSLISIYPNLPFGTSKAEILRELSTELSIPINAEYAFSPEATRADTMRQAALKAQAARADFGLMVTDYDGLDIFTKELKRLGVTLSFVESQHLLKALSLSKDYSRFEGIFELSPQIKDETFISRFQLKYNELPGVFAAQGYDAAHFIYLRAITSGEFAFDGVTGRCDSTMKSVCEGDIVLMVSDGTGGLKKAENF